MEIYIQLIFVLAFLKYCLKASLTSRFWVMLLYAAMGSIIALLFYPIVIEQPMSIVSTILSNKKWVENGAVFTTIEAVSGIFISISLLDNYFLPKQKRSKKLFLLKILPGILFCLAIAYFELLFFSWRVGGEFTVTAIIYAAIIFTIIMLIASFFKYILLYGESIKLELSVMFNMGILIVGLLVSSSVADYNTSHAVADIQWDSLFALFAIILVAFVIGFIFSKINIKKIIKFN